MAMGSLLMHETEAALGWMEKAFQQHDIWLLLLNSMCVSVTLVKIPPFSAGYPDFPS
jgi:hypothetical protein